MTKTVPLVLIACLTLARVAGGADPDTEAADLGFEQVSGKRPSLWRANPTAGGAFESIEVVEGDPRFVRSGSSAIKLVQTQNDDNGKERHGILYSVKGLAVEPDKTYTVGGWARGNGKLRVSLYLYKLVGREEGFHSSAECKPVETSNEPGYYLLKNPDDWQECAYTFQLNSKAAEEVQTARVAIEIRGTVYVDDVFFKDASKE